jgi:hypothetical protein
MLSPGRWSVLYDAGLLNNETHICAVSGGSILAHLVQHWHSYPVGGRWQQLDHSSATTAIAAGGNQLIRLHVGGSIWRYVGTPGSAGSCPGWEMLDNSPSTSQIVANGNRIYQRHSDGSIWRFDGPPCSGTSCPAWSHLDNNPSATSMAAGGFN